MNPLRKHAANITYTAPTSAPKFGAHPELPMYLQASALLLAEIEQSGASSNTVDFVWDTSDKSITTRGTTTLNFSTGQSNNQDLSSTFGSNISSSTTGATASNGGTPDISLSWTAASNVLEVHGSTNQYWSHIDPSTSVDILQLDLNGGEADPYVTFSVGNGKSLSLDSVLIGHSSVHTGSDSAWTLTISKVGGGQVFSKTTAAMGANDKEQVDFNFTGELNTDYILKFSDNGANHYFAAIDNLKFGHIIQYFRLEWFRSRSGHREGRVLR
jgi:hypothetical protein